MLQKILIPAAMLAAATFVSLSACAAEGGLNDLEIAHIAYTAGEIDIANAEQAFAISKNDEVREFAETMVRDHQAVNEAAGALLEKLNAAPQDNPTSQSLLKDAAETRAQLAALKGEAFDKAYAENELAYHQLVNKTLEETLIPATENAELKALLESGLKTFRAHEQHARSLVDELR